MAIMSERSGGQLIVDALEANGCERIFCIPGESYLAVLDALVDSSITTIVCRNEGGAAMMADAHGKLTGEPGICFVTRGPGATNASHGVHIAAQDSTPMILFIGQIARGIREREAFQEVDYRQFFGGMAKWVAEIDDAARIPEFVTRAYAVATSGRPGPVVLALPEDMLRDVVSTPEPLAHVPVVTAPGMQAIAKLGRLLADAKSPFAILGGSRWTAKSVAEFQSSASMLCWRCRHWHQSGAWQTDQGRRSGTAHWRSHERDAVLRLHIAQEPISRSATHPRSPRRLRAWPGVSSDFGN
jgi:acetolactate synthase I/II/III large subunit